MSPKILKRLLPGLLLFVCLIVLAPPAMVMASGGGDAQHAEESQGDSNQRAWDLIWRTMNFAAVVAVLVVLLRKPIGRGLRNRRESIKEELDTLESKRTRLSASWKKPSRR